VRIKVKGGTADHGQQPLCETCRWATIVRGAGLNERIVECSQLSYPNPRIPFAVVSCSAYANRRQANLDEMEKIAWILKSDPLRHRVGFVGSRQVEEEDRLELVVD
jgi:hypothetical protein